MTSVMGRVCFERNKYVAVENNGSYTIFSTRHCIIVSVVCCFFFSRQESFISLFLENSKNRIGIYVWKGLSRGADLAPR